MNRRHALLGIPATFVAWLAALRGKPDRALITRPIVLQIYGGPIEVIYRGKLSRFNTSDRADMEAFRRLLLKITDPD